MNVLDSPFVHIEDLLNRGDMIGARRGIDEWMRMLPVDAGALTAYAHFLRLNGERKEAAATLDESLAIAPCFVPTLVEMARLATAESEFERACSLYEQGYSRCCEGRSSWLTEWIEVLFRLKRYERAAQIGSELCELRPDAPFTWFKLGLAHQMRGVHPDALIPYQRAMELDPDYPSLRNNLAVVHIEMQQLDIAHQLCLEALTDEPENHMTWTNAALVLLKLGNLQNALVAAQRAYGLAPEYVPALLIYANVLRELGRNDEALDSLSKASQLVSVEPSLKWALAMLQLASGDYQNGLANHEARWSGSPELAGPQFLPEKRWNNEALTGKTLFVWGEQGFGDAFQFVRFVPLIAERVRREGGNFIYCCFRKVLPLFKRALAAHVTRVVPHDVIPLPNFDFHIPIGSLPLMFDVTLDSLPAPRQYLLPDPDWVIRWRDKLKASKAFKVGLVWSGSRTHQRNRYRSIPPLMYARAFRGLPGVEFYSLQVDGAAEARQMASEGLRLVDPTNQLSSYDKTAALVSNMDIVITVCTSVAHLSGALGVKTWLLLDQNPHWVWMSGRRDSPWYPTMRLYRQRTFGDWSPVLDEVKTDLLIHASC
ncbi:tetratricopeptide repeat protein [Paraburkholderia susongensis]|nr:tetratricopeptide repeat protein [Paraburkholderia susongensis]